MYRLSLHFDAMARTLPHRWIKLSTRGSILRGQTPPDLTLGSTRILPPLCLEHDFIQKYFQAVTSFPFPSSTPILAWSDHS